MNITKQQIINIFRSLNIPYFTSGKNVSDDSVNIKCPFCDATGNPDPSDHLGVFVGNGVFSCWRCKKKGPFHYLLMKITGFSEEYCKDIIENSIDKSDKDTIDIIKEIINSKPEYNNKTQIKFSGLPEFFVPITKHTNYSLLNKYLNRRKISIDTVIEHGCGICRVGKFMNRMIIPVFFNGKVVSFQAADLTGKAELKYKTATSNINDYLYGYDNISTGGRMIITEGILDKWRVGKDAVCTFGTHFTDKQRKLIIKKKLNELIMLWDGDAWQYAMKESGYFEPFVNIVRTVILPKEHDPDSYGKEFGNEELMKVINKV